jgi:hypothetical protein
VELAGDIGIAGGQLSAGNLLDVQGRPTALLHDGRARTVIADGTRIDLSGEWSNASLAMPRDASGAWTDGGRLSLGNSHDVAVGAKATVDVEAGAALDLRGKAHIGKGGSVSLQANSSTVTTDGSGRVQLGEEAGSVVEDRAVVLSRWGPVARCGWAMRTWRARRCDWTPACSAVASRSTTSMATTAWRWPMARGWSLPCQACA